MVNSQLLAQAKTLQKSLQQQGFFRSWKTPAHVGESLNALRLATLALLPQDTRENLATAVSAVEIVRESGQEFYVVTERARTLCDQLVAVLESLQDVPSSSARSPANRRPDDPQGEPVIFLVHGHNLAIRDQVELFLRRDLSLKVEVMAAGPHAGRSMPEKFEDIARRCSFAVFVITADDHLTALDGRQIRRPRQNVILEIGYFWGRLGRQRTAFLVEQTPELDFPSDLHGIGWIPITSHDLSQMKVDLPKELWAAGILPKREVR
jgi:predicted nucleotide-binding protein